MGAIELQNEPFELSKDTAGVRRDLAKRIKAHNERWQVFSEEVAAINAPDSSADLAKLGDRAQALARLRIDLLGQEIAIRRELPDYLKLAQRDHLAAVEQSRKALETLEADLRQKLIDIGYIDGNVPGADFASLIPDFFLRHPGVRTARAAHQALAQFATFDQVRENIRRVEVLEKQLGELRHRLISAAGLLLN